MAFNKNSNGYTFLFAILMVVLVGAILAFTSLSLKPMQKANAAEKKMMNILGAIGVPSERGAVEAKFMDFVKERVSIDSDGRKVDSRTGAVDATDSDDPFNIDVKKDYRSKAAASELNFPLFVCNKEGQDLYVVPVVGNGLWGPIWGFVALESDGLDDDKQWLTYWVCFGVFNVFEQFAGIILRFIPFYYFLKIGFLVYLFHPYTLGATTVYKNIILPHMAAYEKRIDEMEGELTKQFKKATGKVDSKAE